MHKWKNLKVNAAYKEIDKAQILKQIYSPLQILAWNQFPPWAPLRKVSEDIDCLIFANSLFPVTFLISIFLPLFNCLIVYPSTF